MKVLKPADNPNHTLRIVPRSYPANAILFIRHKISEETYQSQNITGTNDNGHYEFNFVYDFLESGQYDFYLNDTEGNLLHRNSIFATDATDLQNYKIN